MIDLTTILDKLDPDPGGESTLRLRTGTVDVVNADGTLDIEMSSGVVVPGVPKLAGAYAPVGANVQMIAQRGGLLVIGSVGSTALSGAMIKIGKFNGGPSAATFFTQNGISFGVTFPAAPNVHININGVPAGAPSWTGRAQGITTTGFNMTAYGPSATFTVEWQWTAIYAP
jgi:hypothetical protein